MIIVLLAFLLYAIILAFIIATGFWGFWQTRVPYVRSNALDTEKLLALVPMKAGDVFYDLGSGDGRVVFMAERMYGARGVGFELTWWTYVYALIKRRTKRSSAEFYRKNFFYQPWTEATVIYCYLYPPLMRSVEEKFLADSRPGTILISRDFALPTLKPVTTLDFNVHHNAHIYKKV